MIYCKTINRTVGEFAPVGNFALTGTKCMEIIVGQRVLRQLFDPPHHFRSSSGENLETPFHSGYHHLFPGRTAESSLREKMSCFRFAFLAVPIVPPKTSEFSNFVVRR